jgi:hypothetical protein
MTASERTKHASNKNIAKIKERNKEVKIIHTSLNSITSYCVIDNLTNFNDMDLLSLKDILAPKIEEIKSLKPTIAALDFSFVTTE